MQQLRIFKRFDGFNLDVDLTLDRRVTALYGPSGSGKTSVLNAQAGLLRPDRGRILVNGRVLFDADRRIDVPVRRRRLGYVFQDALLFEHMTVRRNLTYARPRGGGPDLRQVVDVLELGPLLERRASHLSGGEKRRVALGRALLSGPHVLLLDEPLTGLDRRLAGKTLGYIKSVLDAFDLPAIYVSHLVSDVIHLADEVVLLERGRVTAQGAPRDLLDRMETMAPGRPPALKNFLAARVLACDPDRETITCRVGEQTLTVLGRLPDGTTRATVVAPARDIILARTRPAGISARNVLHGEVTRITPVGGHQVVFVDLGVEWMVEVITPAVQELDLVPGTTVYAVIKASCMQCIEQGAQPGAEHA